MAKISKTGRSGAFISRRVLLILLVVILILGVTYVVLRPNHKINTSKPVASSSQRPTGTNYSPPTQAQKNATRDQPVSQQAGITTTDGRKTVTPSISSYDAQNVWAFVSGVIEDGGTCTATYTHGSDVITASSSGFSDVNHTTCHRISLPGPVNIQGDWSIVVTYSSPTSYGKSDARIYTVK